MQQILIRPVGPEELGECARVIRESFATVAAQFGLTEQNCPSNGAFLKLERLRADREKGNRMFGLYENGRLCGFMQLAAREYGAELEKLAVLPDCRHKGYGRKLLEHAAYQVAEDGGGRITIGIIEENTRLRDWYAANGFIHTGTRVFGFLPFTVGFMELRVAAHRQMDFVRTGDERIVGGIRPVAMRRPADGDSGRGTK